MIALDKLLHRKPIEVDEYDFFSLGEEEFWVCFRLRTRKDNLWCFPLRDGRPSRKDVGFGGQSLHNLHNIPPETGSVEKLSTFSTVFSTGCGGKTVEKARGLWKSPPGHPQGLENLWMLFLFT